MKLFKIIIKSILITTAALMLIAFAGLKVMLNDPGVRYIFSMGGVVKPDNFTKKEIMIKSGDENISVMKYSHNDAQSNRYFVLSHGFTPLTNKHPKIDLMAASICYATGMNVFIPEIKEMNKHGLTLKKTSEKYAHIYSALAKKYPGKYRTFGSCFGGTAMLKGITLLPSDIFPEKVFLFGIFTSGKDLLKFYNEHNNDEVDIIVKLAISSNMNIYTEDEMKLIKNAIQTAPPGPTDKSRIRRIIGEKLFNDLSIVKLKNKDLESIGINTLLPNNRKLPECSFFILHSRNDGIIPELHGKKLYNFLTKKGTKTTFRGTELFSHTENRVTVTGLINEYKYMKVFFNSLFEGDNAI